MHWLTQCRMRVCPYLLVNAYILFCCICFCMNKGKGVTKSLPGAGVPHLDEAHKIVWVAAFVTHVSSPRVWLYPNLCLRYFCLFVIVLSVAISKQEISRARIRATTNVSHQNKVIVRGIWRLQLSGVDTHGDNSKRFANRCWGIFQMILGQKSNDIVSWNH